MEIAPGIHRIETPLGDRFVALYLLVGRDRRLLIDTNIDSTPREHLAPYFDRIGLDPRRLDYAITSHCDLDHMGGNAALRELAPHATFMCHELDRRLVESIDLIVAERYSEFAADHGIDDPEEGKAWNRANAIGTPIDITLTGGERIRLEADWAVEVLHTPGHSHGHLTLYDPRSRSAIVADAALGDAVLTRDGVPAFPPTYRYLETYLATAQRLASMPIDTLLTSHYPIYRGDEVASFLALTRGFADALHTALRAELRGATTARTTRELIDALSPRVGRWPASAAQYLVFPLVGHLERLLAHRLVETERREGLVAWRWRGEAR